jgi:hypothetical protein
MVDERTRRAYRIFVLAVAVGRRVRSALGSVFRVRALVARRAARLLGRPARSGTRGGRLILVGHPGDRIVGGHIALRRVSSQYRVRLGGGPATVLGRSTTAELAPAPFGAVLLLHRVMVARTG